jgi:hypothetical protein
MDDDLDELEAELGRLQPARPARELLLRVERGLEARGRGWLWAAIPAACALSLAAVLGVWRAPRQAAATHERPPSPALRPVAVRDVLVGSRDEGYVLLADGWPARRVLEAHLDTITWKDPRSGSSLQWSVPRDEIRIVPVSFQ